MPTTILCGVDDSSHASKAASVAAQLAAATGSKLILIVVDQVTLEGRSAPIHKFGEEKVQQVLAGAKAIAAATGYADPHLVSVASQDVATAILNYADEQRVDHIVVGTGEKSAATRFVIGSVSHDLVVRAHCSVTVAR
ncbi:universal stress protein [Aminobacter sp. SR38]|jgi:nucleotide-binding universal stress UspA family protein|uniref:universal stress protein n=1 Tax=Aminobacter sp. SR38 TaxID=2774562 RepID=UPI00178650E9|nr:universal stress protein [Aminobacter sp. SR38]QOF73361.1 universal stress protein [Aminobacter sp. SR38]